MCPGGSCGGLIPVRRFRSPLIGLGALMPKATSLAAFLAAISWMRRIASRPSRPPAGRWRSISTPDVKARDKTYCRVGGFIPGHRAFDPFEIRPAAGVAGRNRHGPVAFARRRQAGAGGCRIPQSSAIAIIAAPPAFSAWPARRWNWSPTMKSRSGRRRYGNARWRRRVLTRRPRRKWSTASRPPSRSGTRMHSPAALPTWCRAGSPIDSTSGRRATPWMPPAPAHFAPSASPARNSRAAIARPRLVRRASTRTTRS